MWVYIYIYVCVCSSSVRGIAVRLNRRVYCQWPCGAPTSGTCVKKQNRAKGRFRVNSG